MGTRVSWTAMGAEVVALRRRGSGEMGDVLRNRVTGSNAGDSNVGRFASLAQSIIARVEVLALLQLVLEKVLLVGDLAIHAQEALLVRAEGLDIDLVLLVGIHDCYPVMLSSWR